VNGAATAPDVPIWRRPPLTESRLNLGALPLHSRSLSALAATTG
jgi:hypothetical protein